MISEKTVELNVTAELLNWLRRNSWRSVQPHHECREATPMIPLALAAFVLAALITPDAAGAQ